MWRGANFREFFLNNSLSKGLEATAGVVGACDCSQVEVVQGLDLGSNHILAGVPGKEVEMRVMRVGRTIDRAVWLAKRGGECQKLDPEIMAGIQSCQCKICTITFRSSRPLCAS
jgi:hypothetical protein